MCSKHGHVLNMVMYSEHGQVPRTVIGSRLELAIAIGREAVVIAIWQG